MQSVVCAVLLCGALGAAPCARADMPPPDSCRLGANAGDPCNNAGPGYNQPGKCVARTCRRANPMAPGGVLENPCLICSAPAGGGDSGGAGTERPSPSGTGAPAGDRSSAGPGSGSIGSGVGGGLVATLLVAVGAVALLIARRRP